MQLGYISDTHNTYTQLPITSVCSQKGRERDVELFCFQNALFITTELQELEKGSTSLQL